MLERVNRLYFMDSMRSVLMLLGVVIHSADLFDVENSWVVHSSSSTILADYLEYVIHIFRMPTFFVISGYFCLVSLLKYDFRKFFNNKIKRIMVPLITTALTINYLQFILLSGAKDSDISFKHYIQGGHWVSHLWFLNNLFIYFIFSYLVYVVINKYFAGPSSVITDKITNIPMYIIIILLPLVTISIKALSYTGFPLYSDLFNITYLYNLIYFAQYFFFGFLFAYDEKFMFKFVDLCKIKVILLILLSIIMLNIGNINKVFITYFESLIVWCSIILCFDIFRKYFNRESRTWLFLSDASYSVYLLHQIIVISIGLYFTDIFPNPYAGLVITISITLIATLILHKYLITKIRFLHFLYNGK
jgi:glucan biosynthesis protein C